MGFGLGPPPTGHTEATQWRFPPTGHRSSLDADIDAPDDDEKAPRPSGPWWRRLLARLRWYLRRR